MVSELAVKISTVHRIYMYCKTISNHSIISQKLFHEIPGKLIVKAIKMSETSMQKYAKRLCIPNEEIYKKSLELDRLIKAKGFKFSETTRIVLCLHYASTLCGHEIDSKAAEKLSGLSTNEYKRQKEIFENLLSLTKKINLNDICVHFELNDVIKSDISTLLTKYSKRKDFKDDINSAHCIAMATYQVLNHRKQKSNDVKQWLIKFSKLKTSKWKEIEADWAKWINEESPLNRIVKTHAKSEQSIDDFEDQSSSANEDNTSVPDGMELYEVWRDRMITIAQNELAKGNAHAIFK